jgi:hypothetical protein
VWRTDDPDSVPEGHRVPYEPGDPVWVGRSRGSEREGTVLRYLGEGFYSVAIVGAEGRGLYMKASFTRAEKTTKRAEPESMPSL